MEGRKLSSVDMAQSLTSISEPVTSRIAFTVFLVRDTLQNLMVTMKPIPTMNLPHITNLIHTTNLHHTMNLHHTKIHHLTMSLSHTMNLLSTKSQEK